MKNSRKKLFWLLWNVAIHWIYDRENLLKNVELLLIAERLGTYICCKHNFSDVRKREVLYFHGGSDS